MNHRTHAAISHGYHVLRHDDLDCGGPEQGKIKDTVYLAVSKCHTIAMLVTLCGCNAKFREKPRKTTLSDLIWSWIQP